MINDLSSSFHQKTIEFQVNYDGSLRQRMQGTKECVLWCERTKLLSSSNMNSDLRTAKFWFIISIIQLT